MPRKKDYQNTKAEAWMTPSQRQASLERYAAYVSELKAKRLAERLVKHAEYVRQRRLEEPEKCRAINSKAKAATKARRLADPEFDAAYRAKNRARAATAENKNKKKANRIARESTPEWQAKEILRRATPEWQAQEKLRREEQTLKRIKLHPAKPSITKSCPWCSKEFTTTISKKVYCKKTCKHQAHKSRAEGRGGIHRIKLSKEALREHRKSYEKRRAKSPAGRAKNRANSHKRRVWERSGDSWTGKQWTALKAEYGNKCLGCGKTEAEIKALGWIWYLAVDHVKPRAMGGTNTLDNLQPLCHGDGTSCNLLKSGDRWIDYRPGFPLEIA